MLTLSLSTWQSVTKLTYLIVISYANILPYLDAPGQLQLFIRLSKIRPKLT